VKISRRNFIITPWFSSQKIGNYLAGFTSQDKKTNREGKSKRYTQVGGPNRMERETEPDSNREGDPSKRGYQGNIPNKPKTTPTEGGEKLCKTLNPGKKRVIRKGKRERKTRKKKAKETGTF